MLLALLAFVLRGLLAIMTRCVGSDAAQYLYPAQEIGRGIWDFSLRTGIHPGFPVLVLLAHSVVGSWEAAGYVVSVLFSSLTVIPFYALVRDVAGRRAAALSCLLLACLPRFILVHADIMTEGVFHFFFLSSAALTWFAVTRRSLLRFLLAGLAGGLAFLTRPEGLATVGVLVAVTVLYVVGRGKGGRLRSLAGLGVGALVFFLVALPYWILLRNHAGSWRITLKGSSGFVSRGVNSIVDDEEGRPDAVLGIRGFWTAVRKDSNWVLVPFWLIAPFVLRRRARPSGAAYLAGVGIVYALPIFLAAAQGYISHRYVMVPVLLWIPFAAIGCLGLVDLFARWWSARRVRAVSAALLGIVLVVLSVRAVHPRRVNKISIRRASLWLRDRSDAGATIYTNAGPARWYLGRWVPGLPRDAAELEALTLGPADRILVVEPDLVKDDPRSLRVLERRFRRIRRFTGEGRPVSIFGP